MGASIDAVAASVSVEGVDLAGHAGEDGRAAIVFSDIEGYSPLTDRLGDRRSQDVLHAHNELLRSELAAYGGTEVKSQGDGFMLVFTDVSAAVRFAGSVEASVAAHDFGDHVGDLRIRVGVHAGDVIEEGGDYFGRTVILAARVADTARGGEVLVSGAVRDVMADDLDFDEGRDVRLKGLSGPHRVHELRSRAP